MAEMADAGVRVIQINGKRFVSGMIWRSVSNISNAKKEIAAYNKSDRMNLNALNDGALMQAGFSKCPPSEAKKFDGAWTLAGVLAHEMKEDSWLGVFAIEGTDEFAFVAVRDGRIIPSCDIVGSYDQVKEILQDILSLTQWEAIYCDADEFTDFLDDELVRNTSLNALLVAKRWPRSLRVRYVDKKHTQIYMAIGGVILLVGGGYFLWSQFIEERLRRELEARESQQIAAVHAEKAERLARAQKVIDGMVLEPNWFHEPDALLVLLACEERAKQIPLNVGGWEVIGFTCSKGGARASYARIAPMTINDFEHGASELVEKGVVASYNVNVDSGSLSFSRPELEGRGEEFSLHNAAEWQKSWVNYFQRTGDKASLLHVPHPPPPEPEGWVVNVLGREKAAPPPPWWNTFEWAFEDLNNTGPFRSLAPMMSKGMVITSFNASIKNDKWIWTAKGELHVE